MIRFLTTLFVFLGVIHFGCTRRESNITRGNRDQVLHLGNGPEPFDLDPHLTTGVSEINIYFALFEGLVTPDPKTLEPKPGAAEHWKISDDNRTWTFYLRPGLRWSDGNDLTAQDFEFAFKRILNPVLGASNASLFYIIEGAENYHTGQINSQDDIGVRVIDRLTLEIRLRYPVPYFLSLLNHPVWSPLPRTLIQSYGGEATRSTAWTRPGNHVGNGPFRLVQWIVNEAVSVEKNPYYWDREHVGLNKIHFYTMEHQNTEERAFLAGQLHATESLAPNKASHYLKIKSPYLRLDPYLATYYYLFNTRKPPFDDPRVRRALSSSIDRQALVSAVTQGGQKPAFHFTPPQTGGYTTESRIEENISGAQILLAQAGFPEGKGFPPFNILINTSESNRIMAEAIQEMWKKNLGLKVGIENQEWKSYLSSRSAGDFAVARASWVGDYDDPATFLELFTGDSGNNFSQWNNPAYDGLIELAAQASETDRHSFFQRAERTLLNEAPIMPIYYYVTAYLIRPEVKNWHSNRLDWHPYKTVYLDE